jgi:hypothetical protein
MTHVLLDMRFWLKLYEQAERVNFRTVYSSDGLAARACHKKLFNIPSSSYTKFERRRLAFGNKKIYFLAYIDHRIKNTIPNYYGAFVLGIKIPGLLNGWIGNKVLAADFEDEYCDFHETVVVHNDEHFVHVAENYSSFDYLTTDQKKYDDFMIRLRLST